MNNPPFEIKVSTSQEFCDSNGTEIRFDVEVISEFEEVKFKYYPLTTGNLFLNTNGGVLEANIFHSIDELEDSDYCESDDGCTIGFYITCSTLLDAGGKFFFTFINEAEETVGLILDIAEDHSVKMKYVDLSKPA